MIFKLFKKKHQEEKHVGLRIQSTVYPEDKQKTWYGSQHQQEVLKNVFEKL